MMPLEPEAPRAGLSRRAVDREREPLRRALAGAVAARRQHVLQRHDVPGLLMAGGRQQRRQQIPGGGFLCGAHLLQSQARLDVAGGAEVIPSNPLRPVPGKRSGLAFVRIEARQEITRAGQEIGGRAESIVGGCGHHAGQGSRAQGSRAQDGGAGENNATAIGTVTAGAGLRLGFGHAAPPFLRGRPTFPPLAPLLPARISVA